MQRIALPPIAGHPALAGHFPGRPIVPGVLLLEWTRTAIVGAIGGQLTGIPVVKFLSPATPEDTLEVTFESVAGEVKFEVLAGERKVASGRLTLTNDR